MAQIKTWVRIINTAIFPGDLAIPIVTTSKRENYKTTIHPKRYPKWI